MKSYKRKNKMQDFVGIYIALFLQKNKINMSSERQVLGRDWRVLSVVTGKISGFKTKKAQPTQSLARDALAIQSA